MNKKTELQMFFDINEATYPYISTCLYWFDNFYYLFNREFKQNVKIDSGTGLIYGPDYMKFFKIVIQKTNMDNVFSRGVTIDGIIQMGKGDIQSPSILPELTKLPRRVLVLSKVQLTQLDEAEALTAAEKENEIWTEIFKNKTTTIYQDLTYSISRYTLLPDA